VQVRSIGFVGFFVRPGEGFSMNWGTWLRDRRMQKFVDVLSRGKARELSTTEAANCWNVGAPVSANYRDR
jgi:hypothetical protein